MEHNETQNLMLSSLITFCDPRVPSPSCYIIQTWRHAKADGECAQMENQGYQNIKYSGDLAKGYIDL